ncbi:unnamed protein product, partial [marine sediment metagenome]
QNVVSKVPLQRIVTETDSPYLGPRRKRNAPQNVSLVVDKLAELQGLSPTEVDEITSQNARRFFNIGSQNSFKAGERVLIVDDVLTTGGSIKGTIDVVNKLGGVVIGIGVLVDRSTEEIDFNVPLFSCLRVPTVVYPAEACPLCAAGLPLVRPGGRLA